MLFFDERFNFLSTSSQWVQVSQAGSGASPLALVNVQAPRNGYAYVYVSNASAQPVYFDNFQVGLVHSPIMEEDHYYAYGLKIAGISSNIVPTTYEGYVANKNLYNDKELGDDGGLDWYDYGYRSYDAQIGRFPQLDPLTDDFPVLTPFQYASNEPVANVDEDGLEALNIIMPAQDAFQIGARITFGGALSIGRDAPSAVSIGDKILQTWNELVHIGAVKGVTAQQIASLDFVEFTKSSIDVDGGRDAYTTDDEGSDYLDVGGATGGTITVKGVIQLQSGSTTKYVSPTSDVKDPSKTEKSNDPDRYYDPEKDAFIALNPSLKAQHIALGDRVSITYTKGSKTTTIEATVGDSGPDSQDPNTLEMSPEAFRQLGIPITYSVPKDHDKNGNPLPKPNPHNGGNPYKNQKYIGAPDNLNLQVRKIFKVKTVKAVKKAKTTTKTKK